MRFALIVVLGNGRLTTNAVVPVLQWADANKADVLRVIDIALKYLPKNERLALARDRYKAGLRK